MNQDYDFQWKIFENTNRWVVQADAKAAGLLATNAVIAGMIFTHLDAILPMLSVIVVVRWLSFAGVGLLLLSAFFALRCVMPRLAVGEPTSVIFFQHIAKLSVVDYSAKLKAVLPAEQVEQVVHQIWANSKVAVAKHRCVIWGIRFLIAAGAFFVLPMICYIEWKL